MKTTGADFFFTQIYSETRSGSGYLTTLSASHVRQVPIVKSLENQIEKSFNPRTIVAIWNLNAAHLMIWKPNLLLGHKAPNNYENFSATMTTLKGLAWSTYTDIPPTDLLFFFFYFISMELSLMYVYFFLYFMVVWVQLRHLYFSPDALVLTCRNYSTKSVLLIRCKHIVLPTNCNHTKCNLLVLAHRK